MVSRLSSCEGPCAASRAWAELILDEQVKAEQASDTRLVASKCDSLEGSAAVDPMDAIPDDQAAILRDPALLFGDVPQGLGNGGYVSASDREEHARLAVRQLRHNKVALRTRIQCWASIFAVGESS